MKNITVSIDEEQLEYLNGFPNQSAFIRQAIDDKRGKSELGLTELEAIRIQKQADLDEIDARIADFIEKQLANKEELRQREIEELEIKRIEKEKRDLEFSNRMEALIGKEPEIESFKYIGGWENSINLMPLVEAFRSRNIKVGIFELRKYLSAKSQAD